jgi:hypothetical protein
MGAKVNDTSKECDIRRTRLLRLLRPNVDPIELLRPCHEAIVRYRMAARILLAKTGAHARYPA